MRQARSNERTMYKTAFEYGRTGDFASGRNVRTFLFRLADQAMHRLHEGVRYRTWSIPDVQQIVPGASSVAKLEPDNLPEEVELFCEEVAARSPEMKVDPYPVMAWAEWELNGGALHPFYDACGRISRCFGAAILIHGHRVLPLYDSRESYFAAGNQSHERFVEYVVASAKACAPWAKDC